MKLIALPTGQLLLFTPEGAIVEATHQGEPLGVEEIQDFLDWNRLRQPRMVWPFDSATGLLTTRECEPCGMKPEFARLFSSGPQP